MTETAAQLLPRVIVAAGAAALLYGHFELRGD